ncbi:MAG: RagB/SusD family nutrient uptake outer membrane protein [Gemmatimonadaceae bacterium]|nr:RagB/SusD family nutrient uptake outer membrane protein [Gemmatimonadaceae bacterium]
MTRLQMKRLIPVVASFGLAAVAAACVDLDEKLITGVSADYYSTPDGLNSAVIASYSQLRSYYGREQLISLTQAGTDTWSDADQAGSNNREFGAYNAGLNSSVAPLANTWNPAYQMINTLNAALERGPNAVGLTPTVKNSLLGEAHFLRAFEYFMLVQTFGSVTLSLKENKGVVDQAVRDTAPLIYQAILSDLDSAIAKLPVTQAERGRATRGAARALRSKVYLTRAYKAYSPNRQSDFQAALADAKAVISSGAYSLTPVYADLWCAARAADPGRANYCENTGYNSGQSEFIFTVNFSYDQTHYDGADQYNYLHLVYLGQYDNAAFGVGIPRDLNNGRPFRRLMPTQYGLKVFDTRWSGTPGASDVMDTRFDGSYQTVWTATVGGQRNPTTNCPFCSSGEVVNVGDTTGIFLPHPVTTAYRQARKYMIRTICPTGYADPSVYCGDRTGSTDGYISWDRYPALKKFQDNLRANLTAQEGGKIQVLLRLGEVYLLAAEAALGLGDLNEAAANINVLRVRAATPAYKNDPRQMVTPAQITLDFIMDERERELAGEFNRWYDLVRPGAQFFVDRVKKYNPHASANVQLRHALRPIPQTQIDGVVVGPKYPQNPGY